MLNSVFSRPGFPLCEIRLFDRVDNQLAEIDALTYGQQETDIAQGRSPDGSACLAFFDPSPVAANPAGAADLNQDGSLNFLDVSLFLSAFGSNDPIADFEADGSFNFLDVSAFLFVYGNPCD